MCPPLPTGSCGCAWCAGCYSSLLAIAYRAARRSCALLSVTPSRLQYRLVIRKVLCPIMPLTSLSVQPDKNGWWRMCGGGVEAQAFKVMVLTQIIPCRLDIAERCAIHIADNIIVFDPYVAFGPVLVEGFAASKQSQPCSRHDLMSAGYFVLCPVERDAVLSEADVGPLQGQNFLLAASMLDSQKDCQKQIMFRPALVGRFKQFVDLNRRLCNLPFAALFAQAGNGFCDIFINHAVTLCVSKYLLDDKQAAVCQHIAVLAVFALGDQFRLGLFSDADSVVSNNILAKVVEQSLSPFLQNGASR